MRYNEITRRYFEAATHAGVLSGDQVFRGVSGNRERGTWVQFDLRVAKAAAGVAPTIGTARFLCFGCPHTIAISAWLAYSAAGRSLVSALPEDVRALSARFELPADKLGRLLVIENAWQAAVDGALALLASSPN